MTIITMTNEPIDTNEHNNSHDSCSTRRLKCIIMWTNLIIGTIYLANTIATFVISSHFNINYDCKCSAYCNYFGVSASLYSVLCVGSVFSFFFTRYMDNDDRKHFAYFDIFLFMIIVSQFIYSIIVHMLSCDMNGYQQYSLSNIIVNSVGIPLQSVCLIAVYRMKRFDFEAR